MPKHMQKLKQDALADYVEWRKGQERDPQWTDDQWYQVKRDEMNLIIRESTLGAVDYYTLVQEDGSLLGEHVNASEVGDEFCAADVLELIVIEKLLSTLLEFDNELDKPLIDHELILKVTLPHFASSINP